MKKRIGRHFYKCRFIYAAFWISAAIFLAVCIARHIWPFGDRSILKVDLFHQYAPYIEEFRYRVLSGKSLVYSWQTGMGKDFIAQTAYYAASPLNILIFLFPEKMISEMIALLILLKVSLCSASFTFYLREHFRRNDLSILIFGLLYGFCAFVTCYYWNIMWLDTVVLFPLTALGCEKLIIEKKITLYYAALTLTMIVNFYLAVLVCLMITLYAFVTACINEPAEQDLMAGGEKPPGRQCKRPYYMRAALRFVIVSVLSAVTAMIILAPVAAALTETEVSDTVFPVFYMYPNVWQLISAHFLGARDAVLARNEDMPNVFSGLLTLVLLPLYYCSKKVPRREKVLYSSLLAFMLLCSCFSTLDYMIHGFHFPANLPHRYTFVYSFILLCMAYRGGSEYLFPVLIKKRKNPPAASGAAPMDSLAENPAKNKEGVPRAAFETGSGREIVKESEKESGNAVLPQAADAQDSFLKVLRNPGKLPGELRAVFGASIAGLFAVIFYEIVIASSVRDIDHVLSWTDILLNIFLIVIYLAIISYVILNRKKRGRRRQRALVYRCVLPLLLVLVIGECLFSLYQNMYDTGDRQDYIARLDDTEAALDYMKEKEKGSFFRADYRRFVTINEGSLYHFNGFSQFSSLAPGGICAMLQNLGVAAESNSFRYYDNSPLLDALFRIRYVLTDGGEFPDADLVYKYTVDRQEGNILIGRNDRVLPLGFMVSDDIIDWNTENSQPFDVQNEFVHLASGVRDDIFTTLPPALIQATNMEVYDINEVGDVFSYTLADPYDLSLEPSVHAEFISDRDQYLCLYVDASNAERFVFETSGAKEDRELSAGRSTINVGFVSAGERITADFVLTRRGEFDQSYIPGGNIRIFAAGWNDDVFQRAYDKMNREPLEITDFSDTEIQGTVKASQSGILLTSIPYTAGWKAFVDGNPVEKVGIGGDGLIGVPLTGGVHEIRLKYNSPFLMPALISTLLGPLLFYLYRKKVH